jgi:hypothetical protein
MPLAVSSISVLYSVFQASVVVKENKFDCSSSWALEPYSLNTWVLAYAYSEYLILQVLILFLRKLTYLFCNVDG